MSKSPDRRSETDVERLSRPWWRRKRWAAAAAFWLALPIVYPVTALPFSYLNGRGWLGERAQYWDDTIYEPADWALSHPPLDRMGLWLPWTKSRMRYWDLGMRHQFELDD
jgi:hypothetical protein